MGKNELEDGAGVQISYTRRPLGGGAGHSLSGQRLSELLAQASGHYRGGHTPLTQLFMGYAPRARLQCPQRASDPGQERRASMKQQLSFSCSHPFPWFSRWKLRAIKLVTQNQKGELSFHC